MENILKISSLTFAYDKEIVLKDINLEIKNSNMIAIVGPNGAGKSTLLKACLDFIKPLYGEIKILNKNYKDVITKVSYVPQKDSVDWNFPISVLDVVVMGSYSKLGLFKNPTMEIKERAKKILKKLKMYEFKDRQINDLSGGQKQRVFIARALMEDNLVYFLDEPFQGIDKVSEESIINILKELKSQGKTIIVVHHDLNTIDKYFDEVILINKELVAYGSVKEVFTKENIDKTYRK